MENKIINLVHEVTSILNEIEEITNSNEIGLCTKGMIANLKGKVDGIFYGVTQPKK
jgi:hypothetical protein